MVRLYDEPPHGAFCTDQKSTMTTSSFFKQCRDDDLLLVSYKKLDLQGKDDIKQVGGVEWVLKALEQPGTMLAFVKLKWIRGNGFISLLVNQEKSKFLQKEEVHDTYVHLYCYHFESLSTTIREFKTLKQSEFCKMAPILLQPTLSLEKKNEMIEEHKKTVEAAENVDVRKDALPPTKWGDDEDKTIDIPENMRTYLKNNANLYNPSQTVVLRKVVDMPENDILLI